MPGGNKSLIGSDNTNGFQKNPQNINRSGANRKSFASINNELRKKGVKALTKTDLIDAYALIFNSTDKELESIKADKKAPYVLKLIITELSAKNTRSKALADYRDYVFGKAVENVAVKHEMTREERLERIDGLMKISKRKAS